MGINAPLPAHGWTAWDITSFCPKTGAGRLATDEASPTDRFNDKDKLHIEDNPPITGMTFYRSYMARNWRVTSTDGIALTATAGPNNILSKSKKKARLKVP